MFQVNGLLITLALSIPASTVLGTTTTSNHELIDYDLYALKQSPSVHDPQELCLASPSNGLYTTMVLPLNNTGFTNGAANARNNTVYLVDEAKGIIAFIDLRNGGTHGTLVQKDGTRITALTFYNDTLYWIQNQSEIVALNLRLNLTSTILRMHPRHLVVGMTISQSDGTLYYSTWPTSSSNHYDSPSIYKFKYNTSTLLISNQHLPRSLQYHDSKLYYVSSPPGIYFLIKQLHQSSTSPNTYEDQVVLRKSYSHARSLSVDCTGELYWNDVDTKRVWRLHPSTRSSTKLEQLGNKVIGVFGRHCTQQESDVEEVNRAIQLDSTTTQVNSSTSIPTTITTIQQKSSSTTSTSSLPPPVSLNLEEQIELTTTPPPIKPSLEQEIELTTTTTTTTNPPPVPPTLRLCTPIESTQIKCNSSEPATTICLFINDAPTCLSTVSQPKAPPPPQLLMKSGEQGETASVSWPPSVIALISVLSTVATLMTLLSVYMSVRVRTLSKKPIIRRRVVVSRRTSESNNSTTNPTSVCEMIDIENCCNMNICETPCYERALLQQQPPDAASSSSSGNTVISVNSSNGHWGPPVPCPNTSKKDDKRCLINM